jgi:hypothetical protein
LDPTQTAGLDYDEETEYGSLPDGVDQTQEMSIESVVGEDESAPAEYVATPDEEAALAALQAEGDGAEGGPATEEVVRYDEGAESVEQAAAEAAAYSDEELPSEVAVDDAGDVDFGADVDEVAVPADEQELPVDADADPPVEQ